METAIQTREEVKTTIIDLFLDGWIVLNGDSSVISDIERRYFADKDADKFRVWIGHSSDGKVAPLVMCKLTSKMLKQMPGMKSKMVMVQATLFRANDAQVAINVTELKPGVDRDIKIEEMANKLASDICGVH